MSEYPTDQELRFIRRYDITKEPTEDLFAFIQQTWHWSDWGTTRKGRRLYLHTGGWSGNESIIAAMEKNEMFWYLTWVESRRGGHYIFEVPPKMTRRHLDSQRIARAKQEGK